MCTELFANRSAYASHSLYTRIPSYREAMLVC